MFRPFRLIAIAGLAVGVYAGVIATPSGPHTANAFDPVKVAGFEVAAWEAKAEKSDFKCYAAVVQMLREQYRYSWWKAGVAGFYLSRATTQFAEMHNRYERALPDLEDAALVEKAWMKASFDPAVVARAQLDWWVTRKMPGLDSVDNVGSLMANEYALRYGVTHDRVAGATMYRAQALLLLEEGGEKPDWAGARKLLTESYTSLRNGLTTRKGF
jgi:hypothetical protein